MKTLALFHLQRLRVHIRTMGDKKYPDRGLARQFMANVTQPIKNPDDFVVWPSKEKPGKDCGECEACLDKVKFGGRNIKKRACERRPAYNAPTTTTK